MSYIVDHLYLGDRLISESEKWMKENKITLIINCTKNVPSNFAHKIKSIRVPIDDTEYTSIQQYLEDVSEIIDFEISKGGNVLVHCWAGISRSASMVIAYLMWKYCLSYNNAYKYVHNCRSIISPNIGFIYQLKTFKMHKNCVKERYSPILNGVLSWLKAIQNMNPFILVLQY
jgi:protein-tyrosine phosphatase